MLAVLLSALLLAACGDSGDSTTTAVIEGDSTVPSGGPPSGANELLRQGTAEEGVNFATSPGGVTVDLNDNASADLTAMVQGSEVEVTCQMESGIEAVVGQGEWPADAGNVTLTPDFELLSSDASESCTLSAAGTDLAGATMEPVGP